MQNALYSTKSDQITSSINLDTWQKLYQDVLTEGITEEQICEAASYSMAMVVRYALGLNASEGVVALLVSDSLSGWIAMATARHLRNAGTTPHIITFEDTANLSEQFKQQMQPFSAVGIQLIQLKADQLDQEFTNFLSSCHNVICGLFDPSKIAEMTKYNQLIDILNELHTPIHSVFSTLGLTIDGKKSSEALYSSSTLSLGVPLSEMAQKEDTIGRHYICDISISPENYKKYGIRSENLFCEQPVQQVFDYKDDK